MAYDRMPRSTLRFVIAQLEALGGAAEQHSLSDALGRFMAEQMADPDASASLKGWRELACRRLRERCGEMDLDADYLPVALEIYASATRSVAQHTCSTLARVLKKAQAWGWRSKPHGLGRLASTEMPGRTDYLDHAQRTGFLAALDAVVREPWRLESAVRAIRLVMATGLRVSEVCEMRWCDVGEGHVYLPHTKTGPRHVVIGRDAQALVAATPKAGVYVHPGRKPGTHVSRQCAWKCALRAAELAGIRRVTPHMLRHTWATVALQAGVSSRHVCEALGWTSEKMLRRYQHVARQDLADACDRVALMLVKGGSDV